MSAISVYGLLELKLNCNCYCRKFLELSILCGFVAMSSKHCDEEVSLRNKVIFILCKY